MYNFSRNLTGALLIFMIAIFGIGFAKPVKFDSLNEIQSIRTEISLLNLLRGLYLSKEQAQKILSLAKQAESIRNDTEKLLDKDFSNVTEGFVGLRDALYLPLGKEKPSQEKASAINQRIKEAWGQTQDRIAILEDETRTVLTAAQLGIIDEFKACLVPPKDLRNPVRVGQASSGGGKLERVIELIHAAPDQLWKDKGHNLLEKVANQIEDESGAMTPEMKADLMGRLSSVAMKIRRTSDVDFTLKKSELTAEMLLIDSKKTLKHEHRKGGAVGKWLLSETALVVLPKWLKTFENQPQQEVQNPEEDSLPDDNALGEKTLKKLSQLYRQCRKQKDGMPSVQEFIKPVEEAWAKNDRKLFFKRVLDSVDRLIELKPDQKMAKFLGQISRHLAKSTGLPLLNPKHDPFGLAAELNKYLESDENPENSCKKIRDLISILQQFKTI